MVTISEVKSVSVILATYSEAGNIAELIRESMHQLRSAGIIIGHLNYRSIVDATDRLATMITSRGCPCVHLETPRGSETCSGNGINMPTVQEAADKR